VLAEPASGESIVIDEKVRCPIGGCGYEYESWPMGWDGHIKSPRKHPTWHPDVKDADERIRLFRYEYADFVKVHGGVGSDRPRWEAEATAASLGIVDGCAKLLADNGGIRLTYNRSHIALGGPSRNFAWFYPRRTQPHCVVDLRLPAGDIVGLAAELTAAEVSSRRGRANILKLKIKPADLVRHRPLLTRVFTQALQTTETVAP
jgi:hypothetical protein